MSKAKRTAAKRRKSPWKMAFLIIIAALVVAFGVIGIRNIKGPSENPEEAEEAFAEEDLPEDYNYEYSTDKEMLEVLQYEFDNIKGSPYYNRISREEQIQLMQEQLEAYTDIGYIRAGTVLYDDVTETFTFSMKNGLSGAIDAKTSK